MAIYKCWLLLLVSFALVWGCEGAAPVTHAYFTKKLFEQYPKYSYEEQQAFMLGTLFPDIRHMVESAREETHYENMTLEDVLNESSPFMAGMKFHSYVDEQREAFVMEQKMYQKMAHLADDHLWTYLKFVEDEILHDSYNWDDICLALQTTMPEELQMSFTEAQITKWHKMLTLVFVNPPSRMLNMFALCNQGFAGVSNTEIKAWNKTMSSTAESEVIQEYMKGLKALFEEKLQKQK